MKYILTGEGRLIPNGSTFEREYFLTDHLGNTRVIFGKNAQGQAEIKQENHYYAYGMEIADQSYSSTPVPNTFLYNGKEYDGNTGYYQYGFRQYDAQIGRWHVIDAMSEKYYSTSPYMYVMGNPVSSYDILGLDMAVCYTTYDQKEIADILGYFSGGGNVNSFLNYASSYSGAKGTSNNGRDHYFSGTNYSAGGGGIYLGSTERGNSSIRILTTSEIPASFYLSNGFINSAIGLANSLILSDARKNGLINDDELMKIFEHYKNELGINIKLVPYSNAKDETASYSMYADIRYPNPGVKKIMVNVTMWDKIKDYDNYNNIRSELIHENAHALDYMNDIHDFARRYNLVKGGEYNYNIEKPALIAQFTNPYFKNVSENYLRRSMLYALNCGMFFIQYNQTGIRHWESTPGGNKYIYRNYFYSFFLDGKLYYFNHTYID